MTRSKIGCMASTSSGCSPLAAKSRASICCNPLEKNISQESFQVLSCGIFPLQVVTWKPNWPVGLVLWRCILIRLLQSFSGLGRSPSSISTKVDRKKNKSVLFLQRPQATGFGEKFGITRLIAVIPSNSPRNIFSPNSPPAVLRKKTHSSLLSELVVVIFAVCVQREDP